MYCPPKVKPHAAITSNQASPGQLRTFVCNLLPNQCRFETLEDRQYTVVPMIILTEGVHAGSDGPLLYPKDELSKTPVVWNHKPIVVYHPEMNGRGISACDPVVINNRKVGVMMNTRYEKGKLKSEAWIDRRRADVVDNRIGEAIDAGTMMELSTGVFVDVRDEAGDWSGESYAGIACNYRPDHLALLPDQIGACSIKDGAGFMRNASAGQKGDQAIMGAIKVLQQAGLIRNDQSFSDISSTLSTELRKRFAAADDGPFLWVQDVFSNFVVYEFSGKLFRLGYSASETAGVTLSADAPVEVVRKTEYREIPSANSGAKDHNTQRTMDKKKIVDAIVANKASGWSEADRDALMAFNEDRLNVILNGCKPPEEKPAPAPATNAAPAAAAAPANVVPLPVANAAPAPAKAPTVEEYIAAAPREVQSMLRNGMSLHDEQKAKLIETIIANKQNQFTKEDLQGREVDELRRLAALATVPAPANYGGQAPVPTGNTAEEPLAMPSMTFARA